MTSSTSILLIGCGAIASAVARYLAADTDNDIVAALVRPGREAHARSILGDGIEIRNDFGEVETRVDLAADCAGHAGLRQHGAAILASGTDLISVSVGALADEDLQTALQTAASAGGAQLRLVSGAIGALDALSAASVGDLRRVTYLGRKPPLGWRGSPAEEMLDLDSLTEAAVHFQGSARQAALRYPKNANVAAAVALAGIGLDDTDVELIADPTIAGNQHQIIAEGDFGRIAFTIEGNALPDNPKSSALTAMSVVRAIRNRTQAIVI